MNVGRVDEELIKRIAACLFTHLREILQNGASSLVGDLIIAPLAIIDVDWQINFEINFVNKLLT